MALNYRDAGVDIAAGEALVDWLKRSANPRAPMADHVVSGIGGFAALFQIPLVSREMQRPCLVSATDGVGTKLRLAIEAQSYAGVGQDLVAMCVNDLVCCGAQPLFFLDYYATGKLELKAAQEFLGGVQAACEASGMSLIGGETAEMPGLYEGRDFDCAGFAVGLVDAERTWGAHRVQEGDRVLGVASSGCHSNGYSLLRKIFAEDMLRWREQLLIPTALYADLVRRWDVERSGVHALAHITGGGMDNVVRVFPKNTNFALRHWSWPEIFREVQRRSARADGEMLSDREMLQTLNCGIGLAVVVAPEVEDGIRADIERAGFACYGIGEVVNGQGEPTVLYAEGPRSVGEKGHSC